MKERVAERFVRSLAAIGLRICAALAGLLAFGVSSMRADLFQSRTTCTPLSSSRMGTTRCSSNTASLFGRETLKGRLSYYREQRGTRQHDDCPADGRSVRCEEIDAQVGELFGCLHLPDDWREENERGIVNHDRRARMKRQRQALQKRLRRLTAAYQLGNVEDAAYISRQQALKDELAILRIPEVESVVSAGELLADLRSLWRVASMEQRHQLLRPILDRVYVDLFQRRVVGIAPRPAFRDLFAQANTASPNWNRV